MDIFKNKYYKVFPLSIFITKCADGEVTFDKEHIKIYESLIKVDKGGNVD